MTRNSKGPKEKRIGAKTRKEAKETRISNQDSLRSSRQVGEEGVGNSKEKDESLLYEVG